MCCLTLLATDLPGALSPKPPAVALLDCPAPVLGLLGAGRRLRRLKLEGDDPGGLAADRSMVRVKVSPLAFASW